MTRTHLGLLFLAFGVGIGLFKLKYEVVKLEQHKIEYKKLIKDHRSAIHILQAELTHLNNPARIESLAKAFLDFKPLKAEQMISWENLPIVGPLPKMTNSQATKAIDAVDQLLEALDAVHADTKVVHQVKDARK